MMSFFKNFSKPLFLRGCHVPSAEFRPSQAASLPETTVTAEIHRGRIIPDALKKDWDRLMDRGRNEPSVSREWTAALFTSHVRETDEVIFIILKRLTTVIGIVPVILRPLK